MKSKWIYNLGLSFIVPGLILLFPQLHMSMDQKIVLSTLILTITWWATGIVKKSIASIFLLTIFSIWGSTSLDRIFHFPLSANFILIVFSFIFSEGIINSGLTEKLIEPILHKGGRGVHTLLVMIIGLNFVLIFVIPQPFSRIIILGLILKGFFHRNKLSEDLIQVLMLFTFATAIVVNMMFIRGDIILNNALIAIAGIEITEILWMKIMVVPTLVFVILTYLVFYWLFKNVLEKYPKQLEKGKYPKEKKDYNEDMKIKKDVAYKQSLTKRDIRNLWMIALVILIWMAEPIHGIGSPVVIVAGTILMTIFKLIGWKDVNSVNLELLIFITAAFSIGGVMANSGVADILFTPLSGLLPEEFGIGYLFVVMILSVLMHMVLGSNITTLSAVVPSLMLIGEGVVPMMGLVFIIHVSVCTHYMLPFHNVILLIGNGKGLFDSKRVARFGLGLTILLPIVLLGVYYIWWQIIGLV